MFCPDWQLDRRHHSVVLLCDQSCTTYQMVQCNTGVYTVKRIPFIGKIWGYWLQIYHHDVLAYTHNCQRGSQKCWKCDNAKRNGVIVSTCVCPSINIHYRYIILVDLGSRAPPLMLRLMLILSPCSDTTCACYAKLYLNLYQLYGRREYIYKWQIMFHNWLDNVTDTDYKKLGVPWTLNCKSL